MADNVTPMRPEPSIPNPLTSNPWGDLTLDELFAAAVEASARIDAARHTLDSLMRECVRRNLESSDSGSDT